MTAEVSVQTAKVRAWRGVTGMERNNLDLKPRKKSTWKVLASVRRYIVIDSTCQFHRDKVLKSVKDCYH